MLYPVLPPKYVGWNNSTATNSVVIHAHDLVNNKKRTQ